MDNLFDRIQALCNEKGLRPGRLCDELGKDGGFILSEGKMLSYRNDANRENYKAVCDFVSNYRL